MDDGGLGRSMDEPEQAAASPERREDGRQELLQRAARVLRAEEPGTSDDERTDELTDDRTDDRTDELTDELAEFVAAQQLDSENPADPATVVLGLLYWHRYVRHNAQSDLDNAVRTLSPLFRPDLLHLVPRALRSRIADAFGTHVGDQLVQALQAGDDAVETELSTLVWWCSFLLRNADPGNDRYGVHLCALGWVLFQRYETRAEPYVDDLLHAVSLLSRAVRATSPEHPDGPIIRCHLATALAARYALTKSLNDLRTACKACTAALRHPGLPEPHRAGLTSKLGALLGDLMRRVLQEHEWDEAVSAGRAAMGLPPLSLVAHDFAADALQQRFEHGGSDPADLDEAIRLRTTLAQAPDHGMPAPQLAYVLHKLAHTYWLRHHHSEAPGDVDVPGGLDVPDDLDAVVDCSEQALETVPDDDTLLRWEILRRLAVALLTRMSRGSTPNAPPDPATADDANRAVHVIRMGLGGTDGNSAPAHIRAVLTRSLARALWHRYALEQRPEDLDETAELLRSDAVQGCTQPDAVALFGALAARVHRARYRTGKGLDALHAAVAAGRNALVQVPSDHPERATVLSELVFCLVCLFKHTGDVAALDAAVDHAHEAVLAVGEDSLDGPGGVRPLYQLGTALTERGSHTDSLADLDAAVRTLRRLHTSPAPKHGYDLHALGTALASRAARSDDPTGYDEAVLLLRRAVEECDDEVWVALSGLSNALLRRYRARGLAADLDEALVIARRAADAVPAHDPTALPALTSLVGALLDERRRDPGRVDVDALVALCQEVMDLTPHDHAALGVFRHNRGVARREQAEEVGPDPLLQAFATLTDRPLIPGTVMLAVDDFTEAAHSETLPASQRIRSAWAAGVLIAPMDVLWAQCLLEYAVGLIPLLAPRRNSRADQQHALRRVSDLTTLSTAVTLAAGATPHPDVPGLPLLPDAALDALRALEQGRAVIHSQLLDTRGDITELRKAHPELAARFVHLRDLLDSETAPVAGSSTVATQENAGETADGPLDRPRIAADLAATIDEIHRKGFTSFARPPEEQTLRSAAEAGPVVVLNCSPQRCDALLVRPHGVRHLPLPGLTFEDATRQADLFHRTIAVVTDPRADLMAQRQAQQTLSGILGWLWDVVAEPVLLALGIDSGTESGNDPCDNSAIEERAADGETPRVWWSPGGLLGTLPLHAAGHHAETGTQGGHRTVLDRVISSYTPTIRALRYARRPRPDADDGNDENDENDRNDGNDGNDWGNGAGEREPRQSLIVAMPHTPRAAPLDGARAEAEAVAALLPNPTMLIGPDEDMTYDVTGDATLPTRAAVLARLTGARVVHLVGHAVTDSGDPSRSRLMLWDHERSPLTVAGVASVTLDGAELAYLSACRTTYTAAADLRDEAIHLTSAFQLAGFRHVVGTLWEADEVIAERIARTFYAALTETGELDCARSAAALRRATLVQRDKYPRTPSLWAGYVHAGA
ncbi:CHAT domain-containing protein [Streptomyces venezuelae]|uniref:CHAT domain-containing protein n=1 Tax=Streptomyces venezuelae TaxID=54571 RepID=UPI0037BAA767